MQDDIVKDFIEVSLATRDDFLKVKETLTRIGVPSLKEKKLFQSCHILHKRGKYYIVHFLEMFKLDGKRSEIAPEDIARRNTIANMLSDWKLITLVDPDKSAAPLAGVGQVKIIKHGEKKEWTLVSKYTMGTDKVKVDITKVN